MSCRICEPTSKTLSILTSSGATNPVAKLISFSVLLKSALSVSSRPMESRKVSNSAMTLLSRLMMAGRSARFGVVEL